MRHEEFRIGLEFSCGGKRWRCTDVGSRVVVAICLEPHEVMSSEADIDAPGKRRYHQYITADPSWFNGPSYGVLEEVFDEYSLEACSPALNEQPSVES
jgi:hypothetical protein